MHSLQSLWTKSQRIGIGLMSGTSADGIDAVLVRISGHGVGTKIEQLSFYMQPFTAKVRDRILVLASGSEGGTNELCRMNFLLGTLYADACEALCKQAGIAPSDVDFVGSHGQTFYHIPQPENYLGYSFRSTLQLGEASVIAERMGCPVISDFRVRDVAAGGQGAPLVPYTEFLLYRSEQHHIALQNLGGIGNITLLPKGCRLDEVTAFDTGPGNMVMDALVYRLTGGAQSFDEGGRLAGAGQINQALLLRMLEDPYLWKKPPKTTGREQYGEKYIDWLLKEAESLDVSLQDTLTTATRFTAECIRWAIEHFCSPRPEKLIVGGGGSFNPTLMNEIRACLPDCTVLTNEDIGLDSNSKEAVAFALLANETIFGECNNAPNATGASHPTVMGKISLP